MMKLRFIFLFSVFCFLFSGLWGCTVRTYKITKERVDLDLEGNRGYLVGEPPQVEREPKKTRTINILEIEIGEPIKIE